MGQKWKGGSEFSNSTKIAGFSCRQDQDKQWLHELWCFSENFRSFLAVRTNKMYFCIFFGQLGCTFNLIIFMQCSLQMRKRVVSHGSTFFSISLPLKCRMHHTVINVVHVRAFWCSGAQWKTVTVNCEHLVQVLSVLLYKSRRGIVRRLFGLNSCCFETMSYILFWRFTGKEKVQKRWGQVTSQPKDSKEWCLYRNMDSTWPSTAHVADGSSNAKTAHFFHNCECHLPVNVVKDYHHGRTKLCGALFTVERNSTNLTATIWCVPWLPGMSRKTLERFCDASFNMNQAGSL